jgi:transposase
MPFGVL